ncbi:MAG: hypothetical protein AAFY59_14390 [Pseudomonadota bacterium]
MNKVHAVIAALAFSATPLLAEETIHPASAMIGTDGLNATEAHLASLENPTPEDLFLLGGVRFLGGVERAMQTRWQYGITTENSTLPLLRVPIAPNPAPEPFEPHMISGIFEAALADMGDAATPLAEIGDAPIQATLNLNDIWLDLNGNGIREPEWEDIAGFLPAPATPETGPRLVTFDSADVAWLQAYTHLLSGFSSAVLAYDPTDAITRIGDARAEMNSFGTIREIWMRNESDLIDYIATVIAALDQEPDAALLKSGHTHMLEMVAQNRIFWQRVAAETDNTNEWIPSDTQTSALGMPFPEGTGETWMAFLTDMEAILKGDLLIPHFLMGETGGINLAKMIEEPAAIDVLAWLHGIDALPYYERGPSADNGAWRAFNQLVGRQNGFLFAAILN